MEREHLFQILGSFFSTSFQKGSAFLESLDAQRIVERLQRMQEEPIHVTHFNQLVHLVHEAGCSAGFFRYYFLTIPERHLYLCSKVMEPLPTIDERGIASLEQFEWGFRRLYTDALLCFGNIRSAYRKFRSMEYEELVEYFSSKRLPSNQLALRGQVLPFKKIPVDDRYLISEVACKAYSAPSHDGKLLIEEQLVAAYRKHGGSKIRVGVLFDKDSTLAKEDPQAQLMLNFAADEFRDTFIENEGDIHRRVDTIYKRFEIARNLALENSRMFLSVVNELDVYVATSMRTRDDFRNMARDCDFIFSQPELKRFGLRYFDPTISAAQGHEDKGLIECLMVKCSKALLYFAGTGDSFGKDAEVAMALSLGKPVIILCPADARGAQRARFFLDVHPLSRLIDFDTGVACGAIVTQDKAVATKLLERIFDNSMEYDLFHDGASYFRLKERKTSSVVRLQTSDRLLRETFWNYYHGVE